MTRALPYFAIGSAFVAVATLTGAGTACDGTGGAATATGSSSTGAPICKLADLGDPSKPIDLQLTVLGVDNTSTPLADGGDVPLITPPQGGRVIFIGVRATNLSPCSVTLLGSLKDTMSGKVNFDKRSVNLKPEPDGYGASVDTNIASFANVPVCPNEWSQRNAYDVPYELTMTLTDHMGRAATKTITVTPRCAEPGQLMTTCLCTCKAGYVLGSPCP